MACKVCGRWPEWTYILGMCEFAVNIYGTRTPEETLCRHCVEWFRVKLYVFRKELWY